MHDHTMRRLSAGVAALGAAALLVAGLNVASEAAGAAKPLLLGKSNKAAKTTKLTTKKGPALSLKSKKGPALAVNSKALVKNLNADSVDGKGLDEVEPTTYVTTLGVPGAGPADPYASQTTTLPAGSYAVTISGYVLGNATDFNQCAVFDITRYIASGGTDGSSIFALAEANEGVNGSLTGNGVATVTAGNRLGFICFIDTASNLVAPVTFTVRKIDRSAAVPGLGAATFPRGAAGSIGR
jgi:hypothetical protein